MPLKTLEIPERIKRRLLHLRILSGTETEPTLPGPAVKNCMRLVGTPIGDVVLALMANGDDRTLMLDPRISQIPAYTREAHGAGLPHGLLCIGKFQGTYFGVPPGGQFVFLMPTDGDDAPRQVPLEHWLDEQVALMVEWLRHDKSEAKARTFRTVNEEDVVMFEPSVDLAEEGSRSISHPKFGGGEILRELEGGDKLEIRFDDGQVRTLLARFVQRPTAAGET